MQQTSPSQAQFTPPQAAQPPPPLSLQVPQISASASPLPPSQSLASQSLQSLTTPIPLQTPQTPRLFVEPKDLVYLYDGSLAGLLCCFYESASLGELPVSILPAHYAQPTLCQIKEITTDKEKSRLVRSSLSEKASEDALDLIETVFLSCLKQKELHILRFLLLAYGEGRRVLNMLGRQDVAPLLNAEKHLMKEAHLLRGFVRFSDYDGVLAANITPKNFILPFIANHFCGRYAEESFVIYDKNHKAALVYENRKRSIIHLEEMPFPQADAAEQRYRALWKSFYHTIAIEARINPRLRMTLMPKRYWENMTEMKDLL